MLLEKRDLAIQGCIMIDKRLLHDTITIQKIKQKNEWGQVLYEEPLTLSNVKFDRVDSVTGSGNSRSETKPSVALIYPKITPVTLDRSYEGGKLIHDGDEFIIRKIIPQKFPFSSKILCYEVEVI